MKKLFISVDMEGVAGTFSWQQEIGNERRFVREAIFRQVSWVIEGIHASRANDSLEEIVLADSHSLGDSLSYDITGLDDRLHLISGFPRPDYMMTTMGPDVDLVFLVGYHAGVGRLHGNMDHTYSNACIHDIWINDIPMNETLINAGLAGYYDVPIGLIVGDRALRLELEEGNQLPGVAFVETKQAVSRYSAKNYPMERVRAQTIEKTRTVFDSPLRDFPVFRFRSPVECRIEFSHTAQADVVCMMPYSKRLDGRTVSFEAEEFPLVYRALLAMIFLAKAGNL
ncbi:MAG TPA: M55 family metallopeptidase [Thermotogota bacterium]|nr:M55 family metallopeptidase [Thermotogota bacterium]